MKMRIFEKLSREDVFAGEFFASVLFFALRSSLQGDGFAAPAASDFVARQSHQNWFRNLRFLKISLGSIGGAAISHGAR